MANNNEKAINPWHIPESQLKTHFEKMIGHIFNAISDDMYLGKVKQAENDIVKNKEEANEKIGNEELQRKEAVNELADLVISLCEEM